jgi:hypothetical protein
MGKELTFNGVFSGVVKPALIIGSEIDLRLRRVAVSVAEMGTTLRTNLDIC